MVDSFPSALKCPSQLKSTGFPAISALPTSSQAWLSKTEGEGGGKKKVGTAKTERKRKLRRNVNCWPGFAWEIDEFLCQGLFSAAKCVIV